MSDSNSASTSLSTSEIDVNPSTDSQINKESGESYNEEQTEALPETGQTSENQSGLIGAALAMLAGLGLVRKSKKQSKGNQDKS
ncbi:LPXTG cell wall anchor domain-containing protein [Staphylococcus edaphicus]|uniref:LPXTG cell wall anchor domain-containing protein n=1 Tax=Staphylococcus edaphicus TaxID=1955013 RepID=UPI003B75CB3C